MPPKTETKGGLNAPSYEDKLKQVKEYMCNGGKVQKMAGGGLVQDAVNSIPIVGPMIATGTNMAQTQEAPTTMTQGNTPPPVQTPPTQTGAASMPAPNNPSVNDGSQTTSNSAPSFKDLFNQDPSTITAGFNPQDRQALAGQLATNQRSAGNVISEALAGIGDAISARGGVNTDQLGNLFKLESDQRKEALDNFDKAHGMAVQNFSLKTQMGENAIKQLAAQDAYGIADPNLAAQLGAPKGTLNKDLPLYLQVYSAKASQNIANASAILAASKQASDENKSYNEAPGTFHAKQTDEERRRWISGRTNDLIAQSHGLVKAQQHGHVVYLSPSDFQQARKTDPTVQQVNY